MDWKYLLAYITGTGDQELLLRNDYLVTENRIPQEGLCTIREPTRVKAARASSASAY
jgi:hypothetical protein